MFLSKLSVNKPVLTTIIILVFVVIGLYSYLDLSIDLFPEMDFPIVTVSTIYPGAGPQEMETLISKPMEEAVGAINGVKTITSSSTEGLSLVIIEFQLEVDIDIAAMDVKDKVDAIRIDLPRDIESPTVMKFDIGAQPIMNLAVSGPMPLNEIYELTDDVIKPELSKIEGLASINIVGGQEREILIGVKRDRLKAYNIAINDIIGAIAGANLDLPSGHITEKWKEYTIRVAGEFDTVDEIRKMKILIKEANPLRLEDVAEIHDTFEEQREIARYNNKTSIGITLVKRSDANIVLVAERVEMELERIRNLIPADVDIDVSQNESIFIKNSIGEVINNMIIGIILTSIVLFLFLHSWQSTLIAALAMPSSIISTFLLIRFAGFTINFMTLMALAISVGILVTNAIVVLENIFRHSERGDDPKVASERGTTEIAVAVAAATLTNIVVFTPIAFMSGIIGRFFLQFGLTVTFATLFSLLVSLTLTPMLASVMLKKSEKEKRGFDIFALFAVSAFALLVLCVSFIGISVYVFGGARFETVVIPLIVGISLTLIIGKKLFSADLEILREKSIFKIIKLIIKSVLLLIAVGLIYVILNFLFNFKVSIMLLGIILLIFIFDKSYGILGRFAKVWEKSFNDILENYKNSLNWTLNHGVRVIIVVLIIFFSSLYLFKYVGSEFFAPSDRGFLSIDFELPPGSNLYETDRAITAAENILLEIPEVKTIYTQVGKQGGSVMMGSGQGVRLGSMMVEMIDKDKRDMSVFEFVEYLRPKLSMISSADIHISERSEMGGGQADLTIEVTGDELNVLNDISLEVMELAEDVPGVFDVQSSWKQGVPEIRIEPDRKRMEDRGVSIFTLASVLRTSIQGEVASKFRVKNKEYDIRVRYADLYRNMADQVSDIKIKSEDNYIPITDIADVVEARGPVQITRKDKKRLITITGSVANRTVGSVVSDLRSKTDKIQLPEGYSIYYGGMTEMQEESFTELFRAMALAIVLTYLVLAAILESFVHPITIMITLPLALVGVISSMIITGKSVSILTLMAMIMLVGIVVNNAILLLDYTGILRKEGYPLKEAILNASAAKFRAIVMANIATILGMMPLALALGEGAEMRAPMAIVSIGGLITSTIFTLFVIPLIYYGLEKIREKG